MTVQVAFARSNAVERTNKYSVEAVRPEIAIEPGSRLSSARSCGVPATSIVFPAATVKFFTTMAFAVVVVKFAVMVAELAVVKAAVILDVAMQVVAPVSAVPWLFVKHRWTVQVFPAESATEASSRKFCPMGIQSCGHEHMEPTPHPSALTWWSQISPAFPWREQLAR